MADTRPTYKPNPKMQAIIERIAKAHPLSIDGVSDAINYALRFTSEHDEAVGQIPMPPVRYRSEETEAAEDRKWVVADARSNPRNNRRYSFDTEREARAHVRNRDWHQMLWGPDGQFAMWNGHQWG